MTIEDIMNMIERDFPKFDWLVRLNQGPEGDYFANATLSGEALTLRKHSDPLPPFAAYEDSPADALCRTYQALKETQDMFR
jgi:hypothetical protein